MHTLVIPIANIQMDKLKPDERTFNKEFCQNLARSIESEGLLHEPIVKPIPGKPGSYKVLTGRNRIYAAGKILKWAEITCKVAPESMTEDEAKAIELAENLWRNNLTDDQLKKALIDWQRLYEARHPLATGKGTAAKAAAETKKRVAEAEAKGEKVEPAKVAAEVAAEVKPFSRVIQETLGVSPATAGRLARVAKNLEKEQIDALTTNKASEETIDKLAALGDKDAIDKAINLIASGMDHAEAVRVAGKPRRERKEAEKKEPPTKLQKSLVPKAPKAPAKPKDADLTDDEWLVAHCDPILKLLKRKAAFKRDAILYRRTIDTVSRFRGSVKKALAECKSASDGNGGYFSCMYRLARAAHPGQWLVCGVCNGSGHTVGPDKDGKEAKLTCGKCYGAAYLLKLED